MSIVFRLLAIAVVFLLLWSVRYKFDHIVLDSETYLVRIHRITGDADIMIPGEGWVPAEDAWSDSTGAPPTSTSEQPAENRPASEDERYPEVSESERCPEIAD